MAATKAAVKKPAAKKAVSKTALSASCSISKIPAIGDRLPGGVMAGFMPARDKRPAYLLIVADADKGSAESLAWGGYGTEAKGLSDWDGLANTKKLVKTKDHPAAQFCAGLTIDGYKDFYLPARDEARLIFASARGLIDSGWHWTSTQFSAYYAFIQLFSDGNQRGSGEGYEYRVRAVRRLVLTH